MRCPFCHSDNLKVLESRSAEDERSIRRRRECLECTQRFTTYERVEFNPMLVVKRSGSKEVYSRDKLISSIVRSCSKSQISALTIDIINGKPSLSLPDISGAATFAILLLFLFG